MNRAGSLAGKTILVSGAGSGIGRACARDCHDRGAGLILLGRREAPLQETLPGARREVLDHADGRAVAAFAATCPPLDGLVLCAGQWVAGTVEGSSEAVFDRMISANLKGPWLLCHHLGPRLNPGASVVLVGSNIGIRALADSAAYGVSKAGVHMLAKVLALEWGPRGIRCNAVAPGPVRTPMVEGRLEAAEDPAQALEALSRVNPMGRLGAPEEVAALAAHLLGEDSRWTTGTVIPLDGGATAVF